MEFFRTLPAPFDAAQLQQRLTVATLAERCQLIDKVLEADGERGRIYCLWGEFEVERQPIRGGVRFSMPTCPNALAWTVTTGLAPETGQMVVHATINRTTHDPEFIESIELFMDAWREGLLA